MGKRLTPEERAARIKEYEEAKAARQAARLEKRKARIEAYEKAKAERARKREWEKRGMKAVEFNDSNVVGQVRKFPTYKGDVAVGDWVGFRWLSTAREGRIIAFQKEQDYVIDQEDAAPARKEGLREFYMIRENTGISYPIKRKDILAKKINNVWIDSCN